LKESSKNNILFNEFGAIKNYCNNPCPPHYRKAKPLAALLKVYKGLNTLNSLVIIMPKKTIKIENVVASTAIGATLDLPKITLQLDGADYNKERFPGVVYRTKEPKTAALIFGSGKIVCTGAKSIDDVHNGLKKVFSELKSMGVDVMDNPEIDHSPEYRGIGRPGCCAEPECHSHRTRT